MKRNLFAGIFFVIFFMIFNQANAQEASAQTIAIENKFGRITWLIADREESSVVFYNVFKDMYDKDSELYEYNLIDPTEIEQIFIDMFMVLYNDFFDCYYDPDEEQTIVMGFIDDDKITDFQLYVLSTGFNVNSYIVNFIFLHNTVNGEQALFCNIEN